MQACKKDLFIYLDLALNGNKFLQPTKKVKS
jgi:hypothetical protein